jgi:CspA family cold shock protein
MSKGRDRPPRRHDDFDNSDWMPPRPAQGRPRPAPGGQRGPAPSGEPVDAVVKWFNPTKGFGFVELADGSGDVFLHISVVEAAGHSELGEGTQMQVQVGQGNRGRQVSSILSIGEVKADAGRAPRSPAPPRGRPPRGGGGGGGGDTSSATPLEGVVKWFNPEKGFGFVVGDDGGKDVFVHISVVERSGLSTLQEGQRLSMRVAATPKGREAVSIETGD